VEREGGEGQGRAAPQASSGVDQRSDAGSEPDARFSFANERTFLAWIRTALALVVAGLAITQLLPPFRDIPGGRRIVGVPLIVLGAVLAFTSYRKWDASERALRLRQPIPQSRIPRVLAAVITLAAVVAVIFVLLSHESRL
jgi:putative membrane protein